MDGGEMHLRVREEETCPAPREEAFRCAGRKLPSCWVKPAPGVMDASPKPPRMVEERARFTAVILTESAALPCFLYLV